MENPWVLNCGMPKPLLLSHAYMVEGRMFLLLAMCYWVPTAWGKRLHLPWVLKRLKEKRGLSNHFVYCLLQDKRGFFWVGTDYGLNRYEGTSCTRLS
jgi:hypothetical protein